MKKILFVGNLNNGKQSFDGQRIKTKVFHDYFKPFYTIDLEKYKNAPIRLCFLIKKYYAICDVLIFIGAQNSSYFCIPFIAKLCSKEKKKTIYIAIGSGVMSKIFSRMKQSEVISALQNPGQFKFHINKAMKSLKKISAVILETESLKNFYKKRFGLTNCYVIPNLRDMDQPDINFRERSEILKLLFVARVNRKKGIFDIMNAVSTLNKNGTKFLLRIYGEIALNKEEKQTFLSLLNDDIKYCGVLEQNKLIDAHNDSDLFVFPTLYTQEGIPGSLIESLIIGTPILSSNYPQAKNLLTDGDNSILFEQGNPNDLTNKLLYIYENQELLNRLRANSREIGKKYLLDDYKNILEELLKDA